MANNWWEKFLNIFTEEVIEPGDWRPDRRPGRIEEVNRPVRPRMISQYPKDQGVRAGKVNRPIRERNTSLSRRQRNRQKNVHGKEQKDHSEPPYGRAENRVAKQQNARPVREKFTGVDFRAADVPSPVYGFRRRPVSGNRHIGDLPEREQRNSPSLSYEKFAGWEGDAAGEASETVEGRRDASPSDISETGEGKVRDRLSQQGFSGDETAITGPDQQEPSGESWFSSRQTHRRDVPEEDDVPIDSEGGRISEGMRVPKSGRPMSGKSYISPLIEEPSPVDVPYNVLMLNRDRKKAPRGKNEAHAKFRLPPLDLLEAPPRQSHEDDDWTREQRERLSQTLEHFNVRAKVAGVTKGPAVTRFEVQPEPGVKVNKIKKLSDDLKLSLAAKDIRIEAPIPGKSSVGIEIPNRTSQPVFLRDMIESPAFRDSASPLTAALGLDISGTPIVTDLQKMPHGLIGGATGSGKSVCINSLLISLLYKASPDELKLVLVDPKVVELAPFKDIPHLAAPVINDAKEAALALKWAVEEMERRYELFAAAGARDIARFNRQAEERDRLPYIVVVIDELADLMMTSPQDVEESICRIAQKARACGIHLVLATQRPSVDVITGLIKANIPTRLAFSVSSQADSRTILDMAGAEKLLGHGDMLFVENGAPQSVRVQGNFVSDEEIERITDFVKQQGEPDYLFEKEALAETNGPADAEDELFEEACFFVFEQGSASASALQRKFRIGYNRAARLIEIMQAMGMISEAMGSKPRQVLMSEDEFLEKVLQEEPQG